MIEQSAKKTLLEYNEPIMMENNSQISYKQQKQIPQNKYLQQLHNAQYAQNQKYSRLKDKSLIIEEKPLGKFPQFLLELDRKYNPIYPQSKLLLFWNFFMVAAILFNFFQIPMALFLTSSVYESEMNTSTGLFINLICLIGFYIDILFFGINTAYYQKGKLIKSRRIILKKYLKLRFWIDAISTFVLTIYLASQSSYLIYLKLIFYIKVYSLFQIDKSINHYLQLHRIYFAIYRMFRIILIIWFITTWVGCIFFAIDFYFYNQKGTYYEQGQLWLTNSAAVGNLNILDDFGWGVWYEYSLYWALQTSSTIGYGDLTPMNPPQVLYCCFVMLFMTVLFAFFINTVWQVISQLQLTSIEYSQNWKNLKLFLGSSKVPSETKQKVSNYLYEVWQDNDNEEMQQIINAKLSKQLRQQFYVSSRWKFFDSMGSIISIINFDDRTNRILGQLAHKINQIKIGEKQYIYQEGDYDDTLYYIKKGKVNLNVEGSNFTQQCSYSQSFGAIQVFLRTKRTQNAQALIFCKLWKIKYHEVRESIKKYRLMYEKFSEITHKMMISRDISPLKTQCWNCRNSDHIMSQCPIVNMWRKVIYEDHQQSTISQFRQKYQRRNITSKKICIVQNSFQAVQPLTIDKITHTVLYLPFHNLK